jgi:hypothetical protein
MRRPAAVFTLLLIAANAFAGRKRMSPLQQQNGAKRWGRMIPIRCSPFTPLMRFSGEHYRQPCDQIERRSVTILLNPLESCPVLRCRSASN